MSGPILVPRSNPRSHIGALSKIAFAKTGARIRLAERGVGSAASERNLAIRIHDIDFVTLVYADASGNVPQ